MKHRSIGLCLGLLTLQGGLFAACAFPDPGTRVWDIVSDDFVIDCQTLSAVDIIDSKIDGLGACGSTPLSGSGIVISAAGTYCLEEDVVGPVTIASSYVTLDLNGHAIVGGTNGLLINADLTGIRVHNGSIRNTTAEGILVNDGCSFVTIEAVLVTDCAPAAGQFAIDFAGTAGNRIIGCQLNDSIVSGCAGGIRLLHADDSTIARSQALSCVQTSTAAGITIMGDDTAFARGNMVNDCIVAGVESTGSDGFGIFIQYGESCEINNARVQDISSPGFAAGLFSVHSLGTQMARSNVAHVVSTTPELGYQVGVGILIFQDANYLLDHCHVNDIVLNSRGGGIALINTAHGVVQDCTITNVSMEDGETVLGLVIASLVGLFSGGETLTLDATTGEDILISNVSVEHIRAEIQALFFATGFFCVSGARNVTVRDSVFADVVSPGNAGGMTMIQSNNVCVTDCKTYNIEGAEVAAGVFMIEVQNATFSDCTCFNITSTGLSGSANAGGFFTQDAFECTFNNCNTLNVTSSGNIATGFALLNARDVTVFNSSTQFNEAISDTSSLAAGFFVQSSDGVILDFCYTGSNTINPASPGGAQGFSLNNTINSQIIGCTSLGNDNQAFFLDGSSGPCLVIDSLASQSSQGFVDLAMTSTFVNNVASLNGSPISLADNYSGIDLALIMNAGDPVIAGGNLSA